MQLLHGLLCNQTISMAWLRKKDIHGMAKENILMAWLWKTYSWHILETNIQGMAQKQIPMTWLRNRYPWHELETHIA